MQSKQKDPLLKQYEMSRLEKNYLDEMYSKTVLLYSALIGAYIGSKGKIVEDYNSAVIVSVTLFILGICVLGVIRRTRKLYDNEVAIIETIEKKTGMVRHNERSSFLQKFRTSTYFSIIIIIITGLAITLTIWSI